MNGAETYKQLQSAARSMGAKTGKRVPTEEYLIRHAIESFLDRLTKTPHAENFVLKGGMLLAAYGARRPTRDADAEAVNTTLSAEHLTKVVHDVVALELDDGVAFDIETLSIREIREQAESPGLRVKIAAAIGTWTGSVNWDVSTGDPIVPAPRRIDLPRLFGDPIRLLGYAPETTIAEKGVTILERGRTSTRWRDYIDIVALAAQGINEDELLHSATAVAAYRGVTLGPITPVIAGYGETGQEKWTAWRVSEQLEDVSEPMLDDQMAKVAKILDPVFSRDGRKA